MEEKNRKWFEPTLQTNTAWTFFYNEIKNVYGTAALVAGLYFISGMNESSGEAQFKDIVNTNEGFRDRRKDFIFGRFQYGIGGWKDWIRKQSLWNFAKKAGKSLYDMDIQLQFVIEEFSGTTYRPVLEEIKNADKVDDAVTSVAMGYLDLNRQQRFRILEMYEIADAVYEAYAKHRDSISVPVRYVKVDEHRKNIPVWASDKKKIFFFRKKLGYMEASEYYPFVEASEDGRWYMIRYQDRIGYVNADKTFISTRMEKKE